MLGDCCESRESSSDDAHDDIEPGGVRFVPGAEYLSSTGCPDRRLSGSYCQFGLVHRSLLAAFFEACDYSGGHCRRRPAGAKQAAEKGLFSNENCEKHTSGAKALVDSAGFVPGLKSRPTTRTSFSAASAAAPFQNRVTRQLLHRGNLLFP